MTSRKVKKSPAKAKAQQRKKKPTRGERNTAWIEENCRIPEGKHVGQPVRLRAWQRKEVKRIYDNPHLTRRAIISFGRKNGKTAFAAFLLLLHLCGPEARPNSQLYSAAQSRDQAAILFGLAAKILRLSEKLVAFVTIRDTAKELLCPELGTFYKALSAEASTAYGKSPVFIVHDELGQVKGPLSELYEALETATAAQEDPLSLVISTQAPTDADLLSVLIDDAKKNYDKQVTLSLYTAPLDLDPFSDKALKAANPALGDFQNEREVRKMAESARRMPSREASYRNLILNQRIELNNPFVSKSIWESCAGDVLESFDGRDVYGGLDLADCNDLASLVLVSDVDNALQVKPTFWLPGEGLREKSQLDKVPYDVWEREGYLVGTPGLSIEYEYIAEFLRGVFDRCNVLQLAFDAWNFKHLRPWLVKAGFSDEELERFVEFRQGFQTMSPALRNLESALLNKRVRHSSHPVLNMCAANAVVQSDPAGNRKLSKSRSRGRIDGMVALTMAVASAHTAEVEEKTTPQIIVL